jgi:hypothetical protein
VAAISTEAAAKRRLRFGLTTARVQNRKVDFGLSDLVEIVRPDIERDVLNNLHHGRVVIPGELDGADVIIVDAPAFTRDRGSKAHGGIGFRIVGGAIAVGGKLGVVELEQVLTDVSMRRQTVITAVKLGDRDGDALARRG